MKTKDQLLGGSHAITVLIRKFSVFAYIVNQTKMYNFMQMIYAESIFSTYILGLTFSAHLHCV